MSAYWIGPTGEIEQVITSHIHLVIDRPYRYGLTREEIDNYYSQYDEKVGIEGKARKVIMRRLLGAGWIRVRFKENAGWTIEVAELNAQTKQNIVSWCKTIHESKKFTEHGAINIMNISAIGETLESPSLPLMSCKVSEFGG